MSQYYLKQPQIKVENIKLYGKANICKNVYYQNKLSKNND